MYKSPIATPYESGREEWSKKTYQYSNAVQILAIVLGVLGLLGVLVLAAIR